MFRLKLSTLAQRRSRKKLSLCSTSSVATACTQGNPNTASATGASAAGAAEALQNAHNKKKLSEAFLAFALTDINTVPDIYDNDAQHIDESNHIHQSAAGAGANATVKALPKSNDSAGTSGSGSGAGGSVKILPKSNTTVSAASTPIATAAPALLSLSALKAKVLTATSKPEDSKSKFDAALKSGDDFAKSLLPATDANLTLIVSEPKSPKSPGEFVSQNMPSPAFIKRILTEFSNETLKSQAIEALIEAYGLVTTRSYRITKQKKAFYIQTAQHEAETGVMIAQRDHIGKALMISAKIETLCKNLRTRLVDLYYLSIANLFDENLTPVIARTKFRKIIMNIPFYEVPSLLDKISNANQNASSEFIGLSKPCPVKNAAESNEAKFIIELLHYFSCQLKTQDKLNATLRKKHADPKAFKALLSKRTELIKTIMVQKKKTEPREAIKQKSVTSKKENRDIKVKDETLSINLAFEGFKQTDMFRNNKVWKHSNSKFLTFLKSCSKSKQKFCDENQIESVAHLVVAQALCKLHEALSALIIPLKNSTDEFAAISKQKLFKPIEVFSSILHQLQYIAIYDDKPQHIKSAFDFLIDAVCKLKKNMESTLSNQVSSFKEAQSLDAKINTLSWIFNNLTETVDIILYGISSTCNQTDFLSIEKLKNVAKNADLKHFLTMLKNTKFLYSINQSNSRLPVSFQPILNANNEIEWTLQSRRGSAVVPKVYKLKNIIEENNGFIKPRVFTYAIVAKNKSLT